MSAEGGISVKKNRVQILAILLGFFCLSFIAVLQIPRVHFGALSQSAVSSAASEQIQTIEEEETPLAASGTVSAKSLETDAAEETEVGSGARSESLAPALAEECGPVSI